MKHWRVAGAVVSFFVTFLAAVAQPAAAAETDCIGKSPDGRAICTAPEVRNYSSLRLCDEWDGVDTGFHRLNKTCSVWGGCDGAPSKLTLHNMVPKAIEFAAAAYHVDGAPGCQVSGSSAGWLSAGQTLSSGKCWTGGPTYSGGVEVTNLMRVNTSGVGKGHGQTTCTAPFTSNVMGRRVRTADCPMGYKKRSLGGTNYECYRFEEQECPCCGGGCTVGNPVSPATGRKTQTEVDYEGTGAFPLRLVRYYSSNGWFSVGGQREDKSSTIDGYWRHNYDRRIYSVPSLTYASAVAVRGDGNVKYFSADGKEILNKGSSRDYLETLSDGAGGVLGWRYLTAGNDVEEYDAEGKLLSITSPEGLVQTFTYSDEATPVSIAQMPGLLIGASDSFGRSLAFAYDAGDRVISATNPEGIRYEYQYSTSTVGNLLGAKVIGATGELSARTYHYENATFPRALTGITDEKGNRIGTYQYDSSGRATLTQGANATNTYALVFGTNSTTITDPLNASRVFAYQTAGGVLRNTGLVRADGATASILYDARGFMSTRTDFNGIVTAFEHDDDGRETSRTEALGTPEARTITTEWHATLRLPTRVVEPGRETTYTYTAGGKRLSETVKDLATDETRTTSYTYNAQGLLATVDGPRPGTDVADVTTYEYDGSGNLNRITNALGHVTQLTSHDASGRPLRVLDPNGVETTLAYDTHGRVKTRTVAGATTMFDYDAAGQLTKVTLPDGSYLAYTYDAARRLTDIEDNLGNRIHYTLDAQGNRTQEEIFDPGDVLKKRQSQVFDALGRLEQIKNAADEVVTAYGYDAQGNRVTQTDAGSFVTTSTPDALNRIKQVVDAADGVTQYGYNALDQLVSVTDPKGLTTTYVLNALGDLKQQVSPDTGTTVYAHDAAGNRTSQTDARGVEVSYTYDALNRLTFVNYPGTTEDVTYAYDGANYEGPLGNGIGRLTGIQDQSGGTVLVYDARGNVIEESRTIDRSTFVTRFGYDAANRLTVMEYPGGRTISYARDATGNVRQVTTTIDGTTASVVHDVAYAPFGDIERYTLGNGIVVRRPHDLDGRLAEIQDEATQPIGHRRMHYDLRGNLQAIEEAVDTSRSQSFANDALSRLTWADGAYGTQSFSYDGTGNRKSQTRIPRGGSAGEDLYAYPPASHRLQSISGSRDLAFEHDAAGNIINDGRHRYGYSGAGRLSSVDSMEGVYRYNVAGQRVTKPVVLPVTGLLADSLSRSDADGNSPMHECPQSGGECQPVWTDLPITVAGMDDVWRALEGLPLNTDSVLVLTDVNLHFVYSRTGQLIGEYRADGSPLRQYVWLDELPLSLINDRGPYYFHNDQLRTPQKLTDSARSIVWDATYEPFGYATVTAGVLEQPLRFPGQYFDAETGLHQNWFRDYDPTLGRYLQSDPIGLRGGISTYGYSGQNPIRYMDPTGLRIEGTWVRTPELVDAGAELKSIQLLDLAVKPLPPAISLAFVTLGVQGTVQGVIYCRDIDDCTNETKQRWLEKPSLRLSADFSFHVPYRVGPLWWSLAWAGIDTGSTIYKYHEFIDVLADPLIREIVAKGATYYCQRRAGPQ